MWANHAVMAQPLARWNEALEYVRATSRELFYERLQWDRPESVPPGAQRDLREMVAEALTAKVTLRSLTVPIPTEVLWSDACSACFGYLREGDDAVYGLSRSYEGLGIYSAELLLSFFFFWGTIKQSNLFLFSKERQFGSSHFLHKMNSMFYF